MSNTQQAQGARLMLILPAAPALGRSAVAARVRAGDMAAVIARMGEGKGEKDRLRGLMAPVQEADAALIVDGRADVAIDIDTDGAHLSSVAALKKAIGTLKPARIAGAGGLTSRHDAMEAGEAGADYVLFGGWEADAPPFEDVLDMIAWWAEVFEVPCVGVATSAEEAEQLARAGADFVALSGDWITGADAEARITEIAARIAAVETAP
ncbi:thiamine phosphate synthase [Roseixanthobacter glucoisosaccharinicivorans]|uniref:thiamine phosphate synthase n=1 Tax=Roseixanthobacter glucoisosaccharinicivorans TaxID=3119923 RepID=UPI00372A9470